MLGKVAQIHLRLGSARVTLLIFEEIEDRRSQLLNARRDDMCNSTEERDCDMLLLN